MNVATTVFKQSTTTSARMSTNVHHHQRTELSALSGSIQFDRNLNRKNGKVNGLAKFHEQQTFSLSSPPLSPSKSSKLKSSVQGKPIKATTILMESNSILNVVQRPDQQKAYRRHSMSVQDERLLKILKATPDEPLYINGITSATTASTTAAAAVANNQSFINDDRNTADNLLMQYEVATATAAATSSFTTDSVHNYENENRPPQPTDKNIAAVANIEGELN